MQIHTVAEWGRSHLHDVVVRGTWCRIGEVREKVSAPRVHGPQGSKKLDSPGHVPYSLLIESNTGTG